VRKISVIVVIIEPLHGIIDNVVCVFGSLLGEVKIDHRGLKATVAHISLNNFRMNPGLQKMGGVAVTKAMNGDSAFGDSCGMPGLTECSLDTVNGHGLVGIGGLIMSSAQSRENENGVSVGHPVAAKQLISVLREGNVTILGSLAAMDMDHHCLAVDVGDLQGESFRDPQAASIDGGQAGVVVKSSDRAQDPEDFFLFQNTGKPFLLFGSEVGEDVPVAFEYVNEEESDSTISNAQSRGRPLVHISAMKKVVFKLGFTDLLRSLLVEIYELTHCTGIVLLGALTHPSKL
jgi:hypothetical protein